MRSRWLHRALREADRSRKEVVELTSAIVGLDTTNTGAPNSGNESLVAEFLADYLRREGVSTITLVGRTPQRQNLVATLAGARRGCGLLLLSHSDVVPPGDPSAWQTPPFTATIRAGRLYGRGAADMKGTVAAQVVALLVAHRLGIPLRKDVRLVCFADEETGGAFGSGWMRNEYPDLLKADLALNEGGGRRHRAGGALHYGVAWNEKGRHEAVISFSGSGAHAATPWRGSNAIAYAAEFVERVQQRQPDPVFDRAGLAGFRWVPGFGDVRPDGLQAFLEGLAQRHEPLASEIRALTRTTVTPTLVRGGVKSNSVPDRCEVICDVRSLPQHDRAYVMRYLRARARGLPAAITLTTTAASKPVRASARLTALVARALRAAAGKPVEVFPTLTVGFTDSRFVREVGTPALGFTPEHPNRTDSADGVHGANESIPIADLHFRARYFAAAIALAAGA
jgi:acetylornithine deacetylase/succinyl-diaminopimelate desuccinylase-like protein